MERAAELFEQVGKRDEVGRTLSGSIQPLILLASTIMLCEMGRRLEFFKFMGPHPFGSRRREKILFQPIR